MWSHAARPYGCAFAASQGLAEAVTELEAEVERRAWTLYRATNHAPASAQVGWSLVTRWSPALRSSAARRAGGWPRVCTSSVTRSERSVRRFLNQGFRSLRTRPNLKLGGRHVSTPWAPLRDLPAVARRVVHLELQPDQPGPLGACRLTSGPRAREPYGVVADTRLDGLRVDLGELSTWTTTTEGGSRSVRAARTVRSRRSARATRTSRPAPP